MKPLILPQYKTNHNPTFSNILVTYVKSTNKEIVFNMGLSLAKTLDGLKI